MSDTTSGTGQQAEEQAMLWRKRVGWYLRPPFTWHECGHFTCNPWAWGFFMLQIIKIGLVSAMALDFASHREEFMTVVTRGHLTLRHQLLETWDSGLEIPPYPPGHGDFALYSSKALNSQVAFTVEKLYNIENDLTGLFSLQRDNNGELLPIRMCIKHHGDFYKNKATSLDIRDICFNTNATQKANTTIYDYDLREDLHENNATEIFINMIEIRILFRLWSVRLVPGRDEARCLKVEGEVEYLDTSSNGQVLIDMTTATSQMDCTKRDIHVTDAKFGQSSQALVIAAIGVTYASFLLTFISLGFGLTLCKTTPHQTICEKDTHNGCRTKWLPVSDCIRLIRPWDLVVLTGDLLTIKGCYRLKVDPETLWQPAYLDDSMTLLGAGWLLSLIAPLRYFKFHTKFNLLFDTLRNAAWDVLAFLVCVAVLFVGYMLVGYVVLGPYHSKFTSLNLTAQTLFAVMDGDELYPTVLNLNRKQTGGSTVPIFSAIFLNSFVFLFTIIVLNLLIAVFTSAAERIQERHTGEKALRESEETMAADSQLPVRESKKINPLQKALDVVLKVVPGDEAGRMRRQVIDDIFNGTGNISREEQILSHEIRKFLANQDPHDALDHTPLERVLWKHDDKEKVTQKWCQCLPTCSRNAETQSQNTSDSGERSRLI